MTNPDPSMPSGEGSMCFEDYEVGRIYKHHFGRTLTETDNTWFSLLTLGLNQVHFNDDYSSRTPYKKPIIPSPLTLAVITGISAMDFGQNTMANLGWTDVTLPRPVFAGDTLYAQTKVIAKRDSKSRPNVGIVEVVTDGFNQHGDVVMTFGRKMMVYRRGHTPASHLPAVNPAGSVTLP